MTNFGKFFTGSSKVATVAAYWFTMWLASKGNKFILDRKVGNFQSKKCYVGQELVDVVAGKYLVFTPPNAVGMAKVFQRLLASGIIPRWEQEAIMLMYADRVQDRAKVKSGTMLAKEHVTIQTLRMEGKIVTVFYLWALCIVISCLSMAGEVWWDSISKKSHVKVLRRDEREHFMVHGNMVCALGYCLSLHKCYAS